jgi:Fic family protein
MSLGNTQFFLQYGITVGGTTIKNHLDVTGHSEAIECLEDFIHKKIQISKFFICEINALLVGHIKEIPAIDSTGKKILARFTSGEYRVSPTSVLTESGKYHMYVDATQIASEMDELFNFCNNPPEDLHPVLQAAIAHYNFVRIHPFQDGNGRGARLLMNLILIRNGYPPAIVRVDDRLEYYRSLQAADSGDIYPFQNFVANSVSFTMKTIETTITEEFKLKFDI